MKHLLTFLLLLSSVSGFGQKFRYEVGGGYIAGIHGTPDKRQSVDHANTTQSFSANNIFRDGFYINSGIGLKVHKAIFKLLVGYEQYNAPYSEDNYGFYKGNIIPLIGVKRLDAVTMTPYIGVQTKHKILFTGGIGLPITVPVSQKTDNLVKQYVKGNDIKTYLSGLVDVGVGYKGVTLKAGYQFGISEMLKDSEYFTMRLSMFKVGITITPQLF